jgi:hypothetical protein
MIEWLRDLAQWVAFATILVLFAHALLTPPHPHRTSLPDSQISPVALGAIYDGADDAIDDDEPTPCCMDQPGGRSDRGPSRSYAMRT